MSRQSNGDVDQHPVSPPSEVSASGGGSATAGGGGAMPTAGVTPHARLSYGVVPAYQLEMPHYWVEMNKDSPRNMRKRQNFTNFVKEPTRPVVGAPAGDREARYADLKRSHPTDSQYLLEIQLHQQDMARQAQAREEQYELSAIQSDRIRAQRKQIAKHTDLPKLYTRDGDRIALGLETRQWLIHNNPKALEKFDAVLNAANEADRTARIQTALFDHEGGLSKMQEKDRKAEKILEEKRRNQRQEIRVAAAERNHRMTQANERRRHLIEEAEKKLYREAKISPRMRLNLAEVRQHEVEEKRERREAQTARVISRQFEKEEEQEEERLRLKAEVDARNSRVVARDEADLNRKREEAEQNRKRQQERVDSMWEQQRERREKILSEAAADDKRLSDNQSTRSADRARRNHEKKVVADKHDEQVGETIRRRMSAGKHKVERSKQQAEVHTARKEDRNELKSQQAFERNIDHHHRVVSHQKHRDHSNHHHIGWKEDLEQPSPRERMPSGAADDEEDDASWGRSHKVSIFAPAPPDDTSEQPPKRRSSMRNGSLRTNGSGSDWNRNMSYSSFSGGAPSDDTLATGGGGGMLASRHHTVITLAPSPRATPMVDDSHARSPKQATSTTTKPTPHMKWEMHDKYFAEAERAVMHTETKQQDADRRRREKVQKMRQRAAQQAAKEKEVKDRAADQLLERQNALETGVQKRAQEDHAFRPHPPKQPSLVARENSPCTILSASFREEGPTPPCRHHRHHQQQQQSPFASHSPSPPKQSSTGGSPSKSHHPAPCPSPSQRREETQRRRMEELQATQQRRRDELLTALDGKDAATLKRAQSKKKDKTRHSRSWDDKEEEVRRRALAQEETRTDAKVKALEARKQKINNIVSRKESIVEETADHFTLANQAKALSVQKNRAQLSQQEEERIAARHELAKAKNASRFTAVMP